MQILLISTYELGRQPVHVASPAAALLAAGFEVKVRDLAVEPWSQELVDWADAVAVSTPMHTAMRMAIEVCRSIKRSNPNLPVAAYGLYAGMVGSEESNPFDRAIVGEYENALVAWFADVSAGQPISIHLDRGGFRRPDRSLLPSLDHYARLSLDGNERLVGSVEASHGCLHMCKHCPLPVVYGGSLRVVDVDTVLEDIDQQVASGATHITFGDPDFLNGPAHSLRVIRSMHARHPQVTFDCTVKVEHILRYEDVWDEFASLGCLFVVSAFESMNDDVLLRLDKGHTAEDAALAVHILRNAGIDIRPSWLPFTPWSTRADIDEMFRFISSHDLIASTDPVQMGIRLLIPPGSLMLDIEGIDTYLDSFDADAISYRWSSAEVGLDDLAARLMKIAEEGVATGEPPSDTFMRQWLAVVGGTDLEQPTVAIGDGSTEGRPRLTESWFC